jgi:diguanylate cyclase (GGDEF)-like protein
MWHLRAAPIGGIPGSFRNMEWSWLRLLEPIESANMDKMLHGELLTNRSAFGLALIAGSVPALTFLVPQCPPAVVLAIGLSLVASAIPLLRMRAGVLALPLLALIPGAGWMSVVLGSVAVLAWLLWFNRPAMKADPEKLRQLRAELRDAEHERTLLHRHIQRYPALMEACLELSAARELDQFAQVLCQRTRELLPGITHVRVYLGSQTKQLCSASSDQHGKPCPVEAGEDQYYVATEARQLIRRDGRLVRLLTPLRGDRRQHDNGEAQRGVLDVSLESEDVGDRLALELLNALGRLGGLGLGAVDLVNQARSLALHDDLTGLFGQHEFLRRLDEQAAACRRMHLELGLIMCDMDHLKRFNDRHGHAAGDTALRLVATILQRVLPEDSIICRYGGEEFAAIIIGRNQERLELIGNAIRTAIADHPIPVGDKVLHVTASMGITIWRENEAPRVALVRADGACYAAKAAGRNRVEVAL